MSGLSVFLRAVVVCATTVLCISVLFIFFLRLLSLSAYSSCNCTPQVCALVPDLSVSQHFIDLLHIFFLSLFQHFLLYLFCCYFKYVLLCFYPRIKPKSARPASTEALARAGYQHCTVFKSILDLSAMQRCSALYFIVRYTVQCL